MSSYNLADDERSSRFVEIALDDEGYAARKLIIIPRKIFWIAMSVAGVGILGLFIGIGVLSSEKSGLTSKLSELEAQMQHKQTTQHIHPHTTTITTTTPSHVTASSFGTSTASQPIWSKTLGALQINQNLEFSLRNNNINKVQWSHNVSYPLPQETSDCSSDNTTNICIEWTNNVRLNVTKMIRPLLSGGMECYVVEWDALNDVSQTLSDCFNVSNSYWYGGYEDAHQFWPFEKNRMPLSSYTTHDAFNNGLGSVQDRYFVSSQGIGLLIGTDVPLYFSLNDNEPGQMCFVSKYESSPYFNVNKVLPRLNYTLCQEQDVVTIQKKMTEAFIRSPDGIPNPSLFRYPIWSTWAQYHADINQTTVLDFTNNILDRNFTCSQIEIDDNWTPKYGDFEFDTVKFPNVSGMVQEIKSHGCAVTAWVHPFFNSNGENFQVAKNYSYLLRNTSSDSAPALTSWWDGNSTGILDVSNPSAFSWYLDILNDLKNTTGIDSFKFDAGELSWLPKMYNATELPANPSENYPTRYVEMAVEADRNGRQEVRSAYKTQRYPVFVRQIDKKSTWDHNNGLLSVIPGVFTFSILGYPFVLPDMIGGNAYDGRFPSSELFVRWIQLNTFLPAMQFSIVPWDPRFNDSAIDVVKIARKYVELHTNISDVLLHFANETLTTVNPIIRPLWWIDPTNDTALTCEDEFLVGDYFLVAPVVQEGQRSRDIYIPSGQWIDMLRGNETIYTGPTVLTNYSVNIDELAYFKNAALNDTIFRQI